MQFKSALISAVALLFAGQAMGAAMVAADPVTACNCPNNCSHVNGSSCKYHAGPSDKSSVVSGRCTPQDGGRLVCVAI
ncbi:hypothetical protein F5B19DRAFT_480435 [Rostrohypoxylon terebratum]|nr:hypothetical protein F5B19DRAFT_480435 [Rostrohypoxylon terebratum]